MAELIRLCRTIVEEHFGPIVAEVTEALLIESCNLGMLVMRLKEKFNLSQIRRSLVILEQHSIVTFKLQNAHRVVYKADAKQIISLVRSPRCSLIAKRLYGIIAESICEVLLSEGRLTCSETLRRVSQRLGLGLGEIKEKFVRLSDSQFIMRLPPIEHVIKGCPEFPTDYQPFLMPDLILEDTKNNVKVEEGESRKRKATAPDRDEGIYWKLNMKRFDRYIRDELVLELISGPKGAIPGQTSSSDLLCMNTVRALLKVNEVRATAPMSTESFPISIFDIMRAVKENEMNMEKKDVEWALKVLIDESNGVLRRAGDSSGGLYVVDFGRAMRIMAQSHIESLIREQLEGRAVRIFRLLLKTGFLEEEQIEKLVMMSSKETRELLYAMMEENYVSVRPLGKTNDFAPARTFYLYHVDMGRTVRLVEENTCKILRNLMLRRAAETREHKTLLDRQIKMESIIENIQANESLDEETRNQQAEEVREVYLSAADSLALEKYKKGDKKLIMSELEIERALFVFNLHLEYAIKNMPIPKQTRQRQNIMDQL